MRRNIIATTVGVLLTTPAAAAPGVGDLVYPARIEPHVLEIETGYGRPTGGAADAEDVLKLEGEYSLSRRVSGALFITLARDAGGVRRVEEIGFEGLIALGRARGVDAAAYVEYAQGVHGPDGAEFKLLLQRTAGAFDGRLNLIVDKALDGSTTRLGYAASADWRIVGDFRAGAAAFGDAGDFNRLLGRNEHYLGPILKTDLDRLPIPGELEIEVGYLFALPGPAQDRTKGQMRLILGWERHF